MRILNSGTGCRRAPYRKYLARHGAVNRVANQILLDSARHCVPLPADGPMPVPPMKLSIDAAALPEIKKRFHEIATALETEYDVLPRLMLIEERNVF